jgi:hypothetical protein
MLSELLTNWTLFDKIKVEKESRIIILNLFQSLSRVCLGNLDSETSSE